MKKRDETIFDWCEANGEGSVSAKEVSIWNHQQRKIEKLKSDNKLLNKSLMRVLSQIKTVLTRIPRLKGRNWKAYALELKEQRTEVSHVVALSKVCHMQYLESEVKEENSHESSNSILSRS